MALQKNDSGILEIAATIMIQRPEATGARPPSTGIKHSPNATIAAMSYQARPSTMAAVAGTARHTVRAPDREAAPGTRGDLP